MAVQPKRAKRPLFTIPGVLMLGALILEGVIFFQLYQLDKGIQKMRTDVAEMTVTVTHMQKVAKEFLPSP